MFKIIGFMLVMTNYNGGPIEPVTVMDGNFAVSSFSTKEKCVKARDIMIENTHGSISGLVTYICMPRIEITD